jgi:hypothetical protein
MGKLNIKNGTPVGNAHLCRSCAWGQIMTGYRESDLMVICTNTSPNIVVPFTMLDCTEFSDKHRPDWQQMEKLAIEIQPVRVSARTAGFSTEGPARPARVAAEDEEEDEAALVR